MDVTNETLWEYIVKAFEWLGSALLAVAVFIFKGYRDEFTALKKDNEIKNEMLGKLMQNDALLLQKVEHMNSNLKNYDNGSKQMIADIVELEKNFEILKMEIMYIKEKL
jgi:hypothetical protein